MRSENSSERAAFELRHTPHGEVSANTSQSNGMDRREGVSGKATGSTKIWMGETRMAPATISAVHHHGESETGIYVVKGNPVFVYFDRDEEVRIETSPGDYVFVPPFVPHREENPSPEDVAIVVLARSTQEAIVVNLPGA